MSPWAQYVVRPEKSIVFEHKFWNPKQVIKSQCYKQHCHSIVTQLVNFYLVTVSSN